MELVRRANELLRVLLTLAALQGLQSVFAHVTTLPGKFGGGRSTVLYTVATVQQLISRTSCTLIARRLLFPQNLVTYNMLTNS